MKQHYSSCCCRTAGLVFSVQIGACLPHQGDNVLQSEYLGKGKFELKNHAALAVKYYSVLLYSAPFTGHHSQDNAYAIWSA